MARRSEWMRAGALLALGLGVSGCVPSYLERTDRVSPVTGDAVAYNKAIHIIDPWPAASARTDFPVSGRRIVDAIERYETRAPDPAANGGGPGTTAGGGATTTGQ